MAEIGIIASVIGVAGAGFRLSLILNAVGCEIASAGMEIHSISKSVTLFSLMLKQVGQALQASDSVHSDEALETARELTNECQLVFDEIQEMLDKVTSKRENGVPSPTIQQKFRWCFKKGRVQYLLGQLESLKMSLLVMLQILQLGKLMASTSTGNRKEDTALKNDMVAQERAETQNLVIVRYWQINRLDRLFAAAEHEEAEERKEIEQKSHGSQNQAQFAIEAPPEYTMSTALIRLPIPSLGELDSTLSQIRDSPRDMLRVSESVIDPLLDRWTRLSELREQDGGRPGGRYTPSVHDLQESDDENLQRYGDFHEREESPRGHLIEGITTDWRKPQSSGAKQEAAQLRKKYAAFQPSINAESSDEGNSQEARRTKKRAPGRIVIDSGSDTSDDSEPDLRRQRRRSSAEGSNYDRRSRYPPQRPSVSHSYGNGGDTRASFGGRIGNSPNGTPQSTPRSSVSAPRSPGVPRPVTNPVQNQYNHSYTSPLPPLHTTHGPNPYAPHSPYSPNPNASLQPPMYQGFNNSQPYPPRYMPPQGYRMAQQPYPRPGSQDGKAHRSPSRHSGQSVRSQRSTEEMKKAERSRKHKNMTKSATKGVLGAGALAGFLEALEGLEL